VPESIHSNPTGPTRRRILQAVALVAAQNTIACNETGGEHAFSIEALRGAANAHGTGLTDRRLEIIRPAVERNLAQIEALRGFDLDDAVEPATTFLAKR
jgi:hypothetical protein